MRPTHRTFNATPARWIPLCLFSLAALSGGRPAAAQQPNVNYSAVYVINADGTGWRKLLEVPGYAALGSPDCSRDGKLIAFDAYQSQLGQIWSDCRVLVAARDGSSLIDVVHGNMPVFSADGMSVCCSRPTPERGVWIVPIDGSPPELLDESGWSAQWSPDGRTIAWYRGRDLTLYDVDTGSKRVISTPSDDGQRYLNYNITWGPESDRLAYFVANAEGTWDLTTATIGDEPRFKRLLTHADPGFDIAWHPEGNRIEVPLRNAESNRYQIYTVNPDADEPAALLEGQDPQRSNRGACWSPDGSELIVVSYDR